MCIPYILVVLIYFFFLLHFFSLYHFALAQVLPFFRTYVIFKPCFTKPITDWRFQITMVKKWNITFPAPTGPEERRAYLYLPDSYYENPDKRYPVLYMFDGHNLFFDEDSTFGKSWGLKDYMDHSGTELIIAAVECNHSPENGRLMEYAPFSFDDPTVGYVEGLGKITMDWYVKVFKRNIDRHYRTLRDRRHTFIAGSSMGGLMSLYAITEYNQYFSGAAALSPSIWTNPEALEPMIRNAWLRPGTRLYMDYGSEELKNHPGILRLYQKFSSMFLMKRVFLTSRIVPYGEHTEGCWEKQLPYFISTLLYE